MSKEILAVYFAGLLQGIALVAFPAASTIFTSSKEFGFSATEYGALFIPQAILAIIASAINPKLCKMHGAKWVYTVGLVANLISMALLTLSAFVSHQFSLSYGLLLVATSCLGIGFGLTVPTLNMMAALLRPHSVDSVILILNALLGIGTALAPVFIAVFTKLGFWWGLPLLLVICLILLLVYSSPLSLPGGKIEAGSSSKGEMPVTRFWLFAAFALLYGIVETLNGNWVGIYMKTYQEASTGMQSMALAAFWIMVTIGRVFFAWIARNREGIVFRVLPFIIAAAFVLISGLQPQSLGASIIAFGLAGFGCSALLPLTISFGTAQLKSMTGSVAGGVIAFYLLGYGIAAFGVGPLQGVVGMSLKFIYLLGAVISVILGIVSFFITKEDQ